MADKLAVFATRAELEAFVLRQATRAGMPWAGARGGYGVHPPEGVGVVALVSNERETLKTGEQALKLTEADLSLFAARVAVAPDGSEIEVPAKEVVDVRDAEAKALADAAEIVR